MKNNGKELIKDVALAAIIFGALSLLVFFNYFEVHPPSTTRFAPVIYPEASEQRNISGPV